MFCVCDMAEPPTCTKYTAGTSLTAPNEQSSGKGHVSGIGLTYISKGIICGVYRCEKDEAREEKMIFFTEPCWERDREKNGVVHQCVTAHRQQKRGFVLQLGFFFSLAPWRHITLNQLMNLSLHIFRKPYLTFASFKNEEAELCFQSS